jgi:RimJ/RimL family protein N-acetyltransferase
MNADPRVMEFFRAPLDRTESDAMVDRIEKHFDVHGSGLWALEVPTTTAFIGFCGLSNVSFSAHFTPCIEIGRRVSRELVADLDL